MKIVLIGPVPPYRGGISHFTQALAENLAREGHGVKTISFRKQYPKWLYPGKSEKDYSQKITVEDVDFLFSPLNLLDWCRTFHKIKEFQPDLAIYPWWVTFWSPATAWLLGKLRKQGILTKVLVHNAFPHEGGWFDKKLVKFALKDGRSFVTMSDKETERLSSVVNKDAKIETAVHPIYAQFPPSGLNKSEVRQKLGISDDRPLALFFGFVRPYKGLGVLLEAFGILKQEQVDVHLMVVGEFWEDLADYQKQIQDLGVSDMVTIRAEYTPDSEAGSYFEAADFFVAPYLDGTQSGSIKIAMGYHLPLVVSDVITDTMIQNYPIGVQIVPVGDAVALTKAIQDAPTQCESANNTGNYDQSSWRNLIDAMTADIKTNLTPL